MRRRRVRHPYGGAILTGMGFDPTATMLFDDRKRRVAYSIPRIIEDLHDSIKS